MTNACEEIIELDTFQDTERSRELALRAMELISHQVINTEILTIKVPQQMTGLERRTLRARSAAAFEAGDL